MSNSGSLSLDPVSQFFNGLVLLVQESPFEDIPFARQEPVDVVIACLAARQGTPDYLARLGRQLRPKVFIPCHHDNFLKPVLISRTASLPLLLIVVGVFGGVLVFGFIGLFLGPTLLALGQVLIREWLAHAGPDVERPASRESIAQ